MVALLPSSLTNPGDLIVMVSPGSQSLAPRNLAGLLGGSMASSRYRRCADAGAGSRRIVMRARTRTNSFRMAVSLA
jgi:hypothetical protein